MLITGEETGSIDTISDQIGDIYEKEVEIEVSSINETLQPVITVAMGFIVGIIVFALFSPLVSMVDQIAGGGPI
jgi:type IV pilus assembly protein PilC